MRLLSGGDAGRERALRRVLGALLVVVPVAVITFVELYPFYWIGITAFKTNLQVQQFSSVFWPDPWTWSTSAGSSWSPPSGPGSATPSPSPAPGATAIGVSVSALGAYALVRLRWRGAGFISTAILITYLMPGIMLVVPLYQVFANLHLVNRLGA